MQIAGSHKTGCDAAKARLHASDASLNCRRITSQCCPVGSAGRAAPRLPSVLASTRTLTTIVARSAAPADALIHQHRRMAAGTSTYF